MKKSCLLWLGTWIGLCAAYYFLLEGRISESGSAPLLWISFFGGTSALMLLSGIWSLFNAGDELAALRRVEAGEAPQDGRLEAAVGPIYPLGAPLLSPFDGRECVAYEYEIGPRGEGAKDYTGFALTPSAIRTSRGSMPLLGWSVLDPFKKRHPRDAAAHDRALSYVRLTSFEKLGIGDVFKILGQLMAEDDGSLRRDFRITDEEVLLSERKLTETTVSVGENVVAMGIYSSSKGGLLPNVSSGQPITELYPGDFRTAMQKSRGKSRGGLVFGIVFAAIVNTAVYFLLKKPG